MDNTSTSSTSSNLTSATLDRTSMQIHATLDVLGLSCPKPLLHTKKQLNQMLSGTVLEVLVEQSKNLEDLQFFCKASGHQFLGYSTRLAPLTGFSVLIQAK